jgi:hypothetical protein
MRGPLPSDESTKVRRNKPTIPSTNLPVSGYRGEYPDPPEGMPEDLVEDYRALWSSPMGEAWIEEDAALVIELVYTRRAVRKELESGSFPPGTATGRISGIEDKLGLSPKSRAAMRWLIVDDPPDAVEGDDDSGSGRFDEFEDFGDEEDS